VSDPVVWSPPANSRAGARRGPAQTYANHRRRPLAFYGVGLLFTINLAYQLYRLGQWPSLGTAVDVLTASGLILLLYLTRRVALRVQDRVIRLEERTRLLRLCPPDLHARIETLSLGQLAALRFASDAEAPALARRVLEEKITSRDAIKRLIRDWRPDHRRV
jgi:hypothetical protein